jgi:hypothetical protein
MAHPSLVVEQMPSLLGRRSPRRHNQPLTARDEEAPTAKCFLQGLKPSLRQGVTWGLKPPPPRGQERVPRCARDDNFLAGVVSWRCTEKAAGLRGLRSALQGMAR